MKWNIWIDWTNLSTNIYNLQCTYRAQSRGSNLSCTSSNVHIGQPCPASLFSLLARLFTRVNPHLSMFTHESILFFHPSRSRERSRNGQLAGHPAPGAGRGRDASSVTESVAVGHAKFSRSGNSDVPRVKTSILSTTKLLDAASLWELSTSRPKVSQRAVSRKPTWSVQ